MDNQPKGAPPVTQKGKTKQSLDRGQRADTGGDPYDRSRNKYSKTPPQTVSEDTDRIFD